MRDVSHLLPYIDWLLIRHDPSFAIFFCPFQLTAKRVITSMAPVSSAVLVTRSLMLSLVSLSLASRSVFDS